MAQGIKSLDTGRSYWDVIQDFPTLGAIPTVQQPGSIPGPSITMTMTAQTLGLPADKFVTMSFPGINPATTAPQLGDGSILITLISINPQLTAWSVSNPQGGFTPLNLGANESIWNKEFRVGIFSDPITAPCTVSFECSYVNSVGGLDFTIPTDWPGNPNTLDPVATPVISNIEVNTEQGTGTFNVTFTNPVGPGPDPEGFIVVVSTGGPVSSGGTPVVVQGVPPGTVGNPVTTTVTVPGTTPPNPDPEPPDPTTIYTVVIIPYIITGTPTQGNPSPPSTVQFIPSLDMTMAGGLDLGGTAQITFIGNPSGIYTLVQDKTHDTLYERLPGITSVNVKIPNPFGETGFIGE